jgi:hypothetical protein
VGSGPVVDVRRSIDHPDMPALDRNHEHEEERVA